MGTKGTAAALTAGILVATATPAIGQEGNSYSNAWVNYDSNTRNTAVGSGMQDFAADNTATGYDSLQSNTFGGGSTATGSRALENNTTGYDNTATGASALLLNTIGYKNVATGVFALASNTSGNNNAALGFGAMSSNTGGLNNTAFGAYALYSNTGSSTGPTGTGNAAQGMNALYSNTTGNRNVAIGNGAMYGNTTGGYNIAIGWNAGYDLGTGSYNIDIGNTGGGATEANTIRIGALGTQTAAYIQGIYGATVTGSAVYVTSSGQLGVLASSERYKTHVAPMGEATQRLGQLRPVTFQLRNDESGTVQYGLIAEEVAKEYPELVIRGTDGQIDGVRYEELAPMLLNEMQRQERENSGQKEEIAALEARVASQAKQLEELKQQLADVQELRRQVAALRAIDGGKLAPVSLTSKRGL